MVQRKSKTPYILNLCTSEAGKLSPQERRYVRDRVFAAKNGSNTPSIRSETNHRLAQTDALFGGYFVHRQNQLNFENGEPGIRVGASIAIADENGVLAFSQPDISRAISLMRSFDAERILRSAAVTDALLLDETADSVFHPVVGDDPYVRTFLRFSGYKPARGKVPAGHLKIMKEVGATDTKWLVKHLNDPETAKRDAQEADELAWTIESARELAELERKDPEAAAKVVEVLQQREPLFRATKRNRVMSFGVELPVDNAGIRPLWFGLRADFTETSISVKDILSKVGARSRD